MTGPDIDPRELVLNADGHVLVIGGAGAGKTTVALHKALKKIESGLSVGQSVLFLSFSRAAVTRILDASRTEISANKRGQLQVQTFHSFCWSILKSHGYLLGCPKKMSILLPQDERALSNGAEQGTPEWTAWELERERLFREKGRVVFDLFAPKTADLLYRSELLRILIAQRHPLIIVDEAQDTGFDAWRCVESLASLVQIICLGDLEQQIFDYLPGIGPERLRHIAEALNPLQVDLGGENKRCIGTEIAVFANNILSARIRSTAYKGVSALRYNPRSLDFPKLLRSALGMCSHAIEKSTKSMPESFAILAPSGAAVARITAALSNGPTPIPHKVLFDEAEVLLAVRLAAFLLEPKTRTSLNSDIAEALDILADVRCAKGTAISIKEATNYRVWATHMRKGKPPKCKLVADLTSLITAARELKLSGDPPKDWLLIKRVLRESTNPVFASVASSLDVLVAFRRGKRICANLAVMWSKFQCYKDARGALQRALSEDQIFAGIEDLSGIHVMTIHKSKGKQFDGVIILREGRRTVNTWASTLVWRDDKPPYLRSRKILRVAITRAKKHVLFLNPAFPECPVLSPHKLI